MFTKFSTFIIGTIVLVALSFTVIASETVGTGSTVRDYQLSKMRSDHAYLETYQITELAIDPLWTVMSGITVASESVDTSPAASDYQLSRMRSDYAYLETYQITELASDPLWTEISGITATSEAANTSQ